LVLAGTWNGLRSAYEEIESSFKKEKVNRINHGFNLLVP
jgi:hypothetical protein